MFVEYTSMRRLSLCALESWKNPYLSCSYLVAHTEPAQGEKGIIYKATITFLLKPRTNAEQQYKWKKKLSCASGTKS